MDIIDYGSITFEGDEIQAVLVENNGVQTVYAPFKKLCDNLGLDNRSQQRKITSDSVLQEGVVILTIPTTSGEQEMTCLRFDLIPMWLTTVSERKVKDEIRPKLIEYRKRVAKILSDVFLGDGYAVNPDPNRVNISKMQQTIDDIERMRVASASNQQVIEVAKAAGIDPKAQLVLTKFLYGKAGIDLPIEVEVPQKFMTCEDIAKRLGIFSDKGKPHKQVVSMILSHLDIPDSDKLNVLETNGTWQGSTVKYSESVIPALDQHLRDNNYPDSFTFNKRSFHVRYALEVHR